MDYNKIYREAAYSDYLEPTLYEDVIIRWNNKSIKLFDVKSVSTSKSDGNTWIKILSNAELIDDPFDNRLGRDELGTICTRYFQKDTIDAYVFGKRPYHFPN